MKHTALALQLLSPSFLAACDDGDSAGAAAPDAATSDRGADPAQTPPQGKANIDPWLDAAHYRSWRCEAAMNPRPKGAHGRNRVCSNARLSGTAGAPYPVGAAAWRSPRWD
jgi:hypothetical protein